MKAPLKRCAIYTRKSSEEGLEQEFNSLDAQREACEAFIKSQSAEGWRALPSRYDDGGYSGGTMDRPGLQTLLSDISAGRIDTVVVYKIDRLTRSLADFARIVELFDQQGVSFVSVTQAFNTTSSMGRLTLNVLLSFAQFEREVTGERIRDKISASKKKGMWMGGNPPLGYDLPEDSSRILRVNEQEARTVRMIFTAYLELKSVPAVLHHLEENGIRSKVRITRAGKCIGGGAFSRGALFHLLRNRVYLGEVPHKGAFYPGLHDALIDPALFDAVQARLDENARRRRRAGKEVARSPLTGRIFDTDGHPMSPTFSYGRKGRLYRYYVSSPLQTGHLCRASETTPHRISASRLEHRLIVTLNRLLPQMKAETPALEQIVRIDIQERSVGLQLPLKHLEAVSRHLETGERIAPHPIHADLFCLSLPWRIHARGTKAEIQPSESSTSQPDPTLINALRTAHSLLDSGRSNTPTLSASPASPWRRRLVRLAFLAPDIQQAILDGRQPSGLTLSYLMKSEIPLLWVEQRRQFGIRPAPQDK